jgi:RNA polymerase sigma factor (sigma-70 family)
MKNLSDPELLLLIQDNNEQAFAVVLHRYRQRLYRQIYKRLGSEDETKDMLQDIYISLWNNCHTLVIKESFLPYLSRAAHYAIVDQYLFRKKRLTMETAMALKEEPLVFSVEENMLATDLQLEFEKQLLKMPLTVQRVFQLSRKEGLSIKEIATKMDLSEQTVKNYISMVLQSLRTYLKQGDLSFFLALASFYIFNDFKP